MLRTRHLPLLLALILALPSAALAQGAGDDQYQDPFGDEPAAEQSQGSQDDLSDSPPAEQNQPQQQPSTPSDTAGATGTAPQAPATPAAQATPGLPRTGSDPRPLILVGLAFVLMGIGLRLRTIDPDAF